MPIPDCPYCEGRMELIELLQAENAALKARLEGVDREATIALIQRALHTPIRVMPKATSSEGTARKSP